jgi:hypothetical protein
MISVIERAIAANALLIIETMVNCPAVYFLQKERRHITGRSKNF